MERNSSASLEEGLEANLEGSPGSHLERSASPCLEESLGT